MKRVQPAQLDLYGFARVMNTVPDQAVSALAGDPLDPMQAVTEPGCPYCVRLPAAVPLMNGGAVDSRNAEPATAPQ